MASFAPSWSFHPITFTSDALPTLTDPEPPTNGDVPNAGRAKSAGDAWISTTVLVAPATEPDTHTQLVGSHKINEETRWLPAACPIAHGVV